MYCLLCSAKTLAVLTIISVVAAASSVCCAQSSTIGLVLVGRVTSPDAAPVRSDVTAYRLTVKDGWLVPLAQCFAQTDAEGRYSCQSLAFGRYFIVASPTGQNPKAAENSPSTALAETFYPSASTLDEADLLDLHPPGIFQADIILRSYSDHSMIVRLTPPSLGAEIAVFAAGKHFELPVHPPLMLFEQGKEASIPASDNEKYHVKIDWGSGSDSTHSVGNTADELFEGTSLHMSPRGFVDIGGSVECESCSSGDSLPDSLLLSPIDSALSKQPGIEIPMDALKTTRIEAGSYSLSLKPDSSFFVSDVSLNGKSQDNSTLVLSAGETILIKIMISHSTARILGRIDGDIHSRREGMVVRSKTGNFVRLVFTEGQPNFVLDGLPPGTYTMSAWRNLDEVPYRDNDLLSMCKNKTIQIEQPSGVQMLELVRNENECWMDQISPL